MIDLSVDALKQVNLVDFLSQHYGLKFRRRGTEYACCSPFTTESTPSFFVRVVNGHWLFKDFSGGAGGSILDFIQLKENLGSFSHALGFLRRLLGPYASPMEQGAGNSEGGSRQHGPYDVEYLYRRFRREDSAVCREYLLARGIAPELVDALIKEGTVVHNRHEGRSYCCFAVRDNAGKLKCLDNHAIDGSGKFVLGPKSPFSLEWDRVKRAREVFLAEGIMDYLSVKTLERTPLPGIALLGNQLCFETSLLQNAPVLVAAFDSDDGGLSALYDLQERYPGKKIRVYDKEDHKDPNDLLMSVRSGKARKLSSERKLQL